MIGITTWEYLDFDGRRTLKDVKGKCCQERNFPFSQSAIGYETPAEVDTQRQESYDKDGRKERSFYRITGVDNPDSL